MKTTKTVNNQATTPTPEVCPTCGEELTACENCEVNICTCCNEDWRTTRDDVILCPECVAALTEDYNKQTDNGTKVCGTCAHFVGMDTDGDGLCRRDILDYHKTDYCKNFFQPAPTGSVTFEVDGTMTLQWGEESKHFDSLSRLVNYCRENNIHVAETHTVRIIESV